MDSDDKRFHVHGVVADANGKGIEGVSVTLWWQRIRERVPLAHGRTGDDGRYFLDYEIPENAPGKVLLVVGAEGGGLEAPLESPRTVATADLSINLTVAAADPSQYATLLAAIAPLLQGMTLMDLVENDEHQDISFLATETGSGTEQVMRLVVAAHLENAFQITAPAWFAFLVLRVPASLPPS